MKKFYAFVLLACHGNIYSATAQQIEKAQAPLRQIQEEMRTLKTTLKTKIQPVTAKSLALAKDVQGKKANALEKITAHERAMKAIVSTSSVMAHLGADKTRLGSLASAYSKTYSDLAAPSKTFDRIVNPMVETINATNNDLDAMTKDGGLIDQIIESQGETLAQLEKAKSLASAPKGPSDEFDF